MKKILVPVLLFSLLAGCQQPEHHKDVPHRNYELRDHACELHDCTN